MYSGLIDTTKKLGSIFRLIGPQKQIIVNENGSQGVGGWRLEVGWGRDAGTAASPVE
jgi:hypothetical protein